MLARQGGTWRRRIGRGVLLLGAVVLSLLFVEAALRGVIRAGKLPSRLPDPESSRFWDPGHPVFGVWHRPNASEIHTASCFRAEYRTNSIGARDAERDTAARGPRVIALGDSFIEGWGLAQADRLTDRLERATGIEHVNLAMSHFGPWQSFLAYREFAPRFQHDRVLVGIVPVNDFADLDYDAAQHTPAYEYRYRPYLVGDYPDYRQVSMRERAVGRLLRRHSEAHNLFSRFYHDLLGYDESGSRASGVDAAGLVHSYFHVHTPKQLDLLWYCIERILDAAEGRPVTVVLLPAHRDFIRYYQSGPGPLAAELRRRGAGRPLTVVDLLPEMSRLTSQWDSFFFSCDYHWNARGNEGAALVLMRHLAGTFYPAGRVR